MYDDTANSAIFGDKQCWGHSVLQTPALVKFRLIQSYMSYSYQSDQQLKCFATVP